jgi:DNA (cytosine-5)-methyltransferase 1
VRIVEALAAEFCCGVGGLSEGLSRAGWRVVYAFDKDAAAVEYYRRNHPGIGNGCRKIDLKEMRPAEWAELGRACRLWAAGLPCQPFSTLGKRLGDKDPRDLWPTFRVGVEIGRPLWILLENVPGIRRWHDPPNDLRALGYKAWETVLKAVEYGVPQLRHRWFCVATLLKDAEFSWPEPTHSGSTWQAAIFAPKSVTPAEVTTVPLRKPVTVVANESRGITGYKRYRGRAVTVADHIGRKITVEEAAALQCLPIGWSWPSSYAAAMRLIGNAVPPPFGEALGRAILEAWRRVEDGSEAQERVAG